MVAEIPQECLEQYGCGDITKPIEAAVYTPFVEVTVSGVRMLTTGNESSPSVDNHAMIISFQYGTSTGTGGCGMRIEVADEGGIMFKRFAQATNKDLTKSQSQLTGVPGCAVEFGWLVTDCNNITTKQTNVSIGSPYAGPVHFLPMTIDTTFSEGVIKFVFEGVDLFVRSFDHRLEKPMADEAGKIDLKSALRELFMEKDPKFAGVEFRRWNHKPGMDEFDFKPALGGKDGHKSTHPTEQESNVACSRKWLLQNRTEDDLGVLVMYQPGGDGTPGSVVFQEDPRGPGQPACCDNTIATYIVNGGNESPVLSFNPSIKWPLGGNAGDGGVPSGASTGESNKKANEKESGKEVQNTGAQVGFNVPQENWQHQVPDNHADLMLVNSTVHNSAAKPYEALANAIEAELKVMGDPRFVNPVSLTGKDIALIVIDPYYFDGGSDWSDVGDWLEQPTCNPILSNKKWMILGCDHQIQNGQYVTTFKLKLSAPNIDISAGQPYGGCGTETPTENTAKEPEK